jgi:hypothetical protein
MLNERLHFADPGDIATEITDGLKRKDMFNIICPDCLRKILVNTL